MRVLLLATKCKFRFIAHTLQNRISPQTLLTRARTRCCVTRTLSISNSGLPVQDDSKARREQFEKAKNVAFNFVMKRTVSQQQLRKKLKEKGISDEEVIQITLDRMVELRLQSDLEYATSFAMTKWKRNKWSFKKIEQELKNQHGMDGKTIEKAFQESFLHVKEDAFDDEYYFRELLNQVQARVNGPLHRFDVVTKKRRITSWLSRRQHPWNVIYRIVNEVNWN